MNTDFYSIDRGTMKGLIDHRTTVRLKFNFSVLEFKKLVQGYGSWIDTTELLN